MGYMSKLKLLLLDGNPFRTLRRDIIQVIIRVHSAVKNVYNHRKKLIVICC